jgi:putative DNA primase/helicase
VRAYIADGKPQVCGPLGSYAAWSSMVRSPLIWLGLPDPVTSMDEVRAENPELQLISEFYRLWLDYRLGLNTPYTVARIIELAKTQTPSKFNPPALHDFLLRVARDKNRNEVSPERLGWWLRRNCRVVDVRMPNAPSATYQLVKGQDAHTKVATYALMKV